MTITDEQIEKAEAQFTEWFVKNYPGPDTIIGKPEWHSPRIFSRARAALEAVMPEGEPVAWGAAYGGKIATISLTKTRHHTAPLYAHPAPEPGEVERLQAENERLREALRFYRDEWEDDADQEWISPTHSVGSISTEPSDALRSDKGSRARAALAEGDGDE